MKSMIPFSDCGLCVINDHCEKFRNEKFRNGPRALRFVPPIPHNDSDSPIVSVFVSFYQALRLIGKGKMDIFVLL